MDALDLYVLGRRLGKVGEAALGRPGAERLSPAAALVLGDVLTHPGSSISEITDRTGFPQSYVSKWVNLLRDQQVVETFTDPADGRRTLVRSTRTAARRIRQRAKTPFDDLLRGALGTDDPAVLVEVEAALEVLVARFVPKGTRRGDEDPD
ncbi:MarR family winged helix-turn-helix transcriptional regulator [Actinomadura sp. DC4]|uniref:MarR family winged helix-turn-helix transcriptional regulator n=1 Tax=Actinomadura sp. DC4 TaxID=3055069 RepID=UPI0025B23633|nr:MarR family winged helix-turn-helix transcriptional regulator [Actinomadura sp. DC4]MDN3353177.1 MarR family winged helix-turn-helix transcriptional regulator [Actinomadura sp. DC4]